MREIFDIHQYGCVSVTRDTGQLVVGDKEFLLSDRAGNLGNVNILAIFIDLANKGERASLKTMGELSEATSANAFRSRLSQLRRKLEGFEIARGVSANALFLSDRLVGNQNDDLANGQEKLPYHFNAKLADQITRFGFNIPSNELAVTRTEGTMVIGPHSHPEEYLAGLGLGLN